MLSYISRKLTGYIVVEIKGEEKERLINLAVKQGIRFWDYKKTDEIYVVSMRIYEYKKLHKVKKRCRVKLKILKKCGLPIWTMPYKNRFGILAGIIAIIPLFLYATGHIWVLSASGSNFYTEPQVLSLAEDFGLYVGADKDDFSGSLVSTKLMESMDKTTWVAVNNKGVVAEILIVDAIEKPQKETTSDLQNITAKRSGVITYIKAESGIPRVEVGDVVKQGEVLISGIWQNCNMWGEVIPNVFTDSSRGTVLAETSRTFVVSMPLTEKSYINGETCERKYLNFFGLSIPINFVQINKGEYKKEIIENNLFLIDVKMPISVERQIYTKVTETKRTLTEEEATRELLIMLKQQQVDTIGVFGEILSENNQIEIKNDTITLTSNCQCIENIGVETKILLE